MLLKCFFIFKYLYVRNLFFFLYFYVDDGIWINYLFLNIVCIIILNELLLINIGIKGFEIMKNNFILKNNNK